MTERIKKYQSEISDLEAESLELKRKTRIIIASRLLVFIGTIYGCFTLYNTPLILTITCIIGISSFLALLILDQRTGNKRTYLTSRIKVLQREINGLNGNFEDNGNGTEYSIPNHAFSHDIDLFGDGSFFQSVNKTSSKQGEQILANLFTSNNEKRIKEKQDTTKELSEKPEFFINFSAISGTIEKDLSLSEIQDWLKSSKFEKSNDLTKVLLLAFPILSVAVIAATSAALIPSSYLIWWIILGIGIVGQQLKKTNQLANALKHLSQATDQYSKLLKLINETHWTSSKLANLQKQTASEGEEASIILQKFSKNLENLDHRNNLLIGFFGNALLLWDIQCTSRINEWLNQYARTASKWFDVIHEMDALLSLGNYAYNHSENTFPTLSDTSQIKAVNLAHPLIPESKSIKNDIDLTREQFIIITGANMAGKSTFLRTISLSIIMANCGLPVHAEEYHYFPIKLITSMRTTDSLQAEESYFFSELKRLKFITEAIIYEPHFIILDEILKGTNSKDKEEGSKKFVQKLVNQKAQGIIATHDLGLCTLADTNEQISNKYFDAEIVNDELYFDYKMKEGICKNMNASFLLQKMDIT